MKYDGTQSLIFTTPSKFLASLEELNDNNVEYLVYAAIRTDQQDIFCLYCEKNIINEGYFGLMKDPGFKEILGISLCKDCENVMHYKTLFEILKLKINEVFTRPEIRMLGQQTL